MNSRPNNKGGVESDPSIYVPTLIPPLMYAHVCPYIFRSADPSTQPESLAFLDTLALKSIVLLSLEYPSKQLESYCHKNHIEIYHFGIERRWPAPNLPEHGQTKPPSHMFFSSYEINSFSVFESIVKDALELLLDVRNHPVLVTDMYVLCSSNLSSGIFETGTLLGCLRKIQGWSLSSILFEYRSFAGSFARSANERFIEVSIRLLTRQMFDTDLVTMPPVEFIPDWLLPPQQFYVDESERSDSASHSHSHSHSHSD